MFYYEYFAEKGQGNMPPKPKFTKDDIIQCAMELVRKYGMDHVTARELGKALNSSARPIFTVFSSMEEVKKEVVALAKAKYRSFVEEGLKKSIAFRGVGMAYISFAIEEPKLFQLLFMSEVEQNDSLQSVLQSVEDSYDLILRSIMEPYGLDKEKAIKLYHHLWIYTHGIATMCATNLCRFKENQIEEMLSEIFKSLLPTLKREK